MQAKLRVSGELEEPVRLEGSRTPCHQNPTDFQSGTLFVSHFCETMSRCIYRYDYGAWEASRAQMSVSAFEILMIKLNITRVHFQPPLKISFT